MRSRSKYGAIRTTVDGITFDSKGEANRWCELKLLKLAGQIKDLVHQPVFQLQVRGPDHVVVIGHYRADFSYMENGNLCVEDFKGVMTPLSRWKIKHTEAQYGITVRIIRSSGRRA